jgi:heat shock transcription factor
MGTGSSLEQGTQTAFEPLEPLASLANGVSSDLESSSVEAKGFEVQQGVRSGGSECLNGRPSAELNDDFWEDLLHEGGLGAGNAVGQDDMKM